MIDTLPSVRGGKSESNSWAYCAAFLCISLAPSSSFERWFRCLFLLFCFAASSEASGAKATRMASTAEICFKKLFFMVCRASNASRQARDVCHCLGLYPETTEPGSSKRFMCYSPVLYTVKACYKSTNNSPRGRTGNFSFKAQCSHVPLLKSARQL